MRISKILYRGIEVLRDAKDIFTYGPIPACFIGYFQAFENSCRHLNLGTLSIVFCKFSIALFSCKVLNHEQVSLLP
ncbi:hypothetical protein AMTR_s00048p00025390 [Amborella trichopoda]|uniref:Uncharacterized protein n=1 Tax=Amborella trichopoda TaxID=13333 RepID=U5CZR7_AMBTC|nr:hypothetical protein AMTR_s00048p00025390 [Amborella trichopoda]